MYFDLSWELLRRWEVWAALIVGTLLGAVVFQLAYRMVHRALERRNSRRRWGNPVTVLMETYQAPEARQQGLVVNRSTGGLGLLVDRSYEPGTLMRVRVDEAPANIPWIQVEVRHCRPAGRNWIMGCRFTEAVNWDVYAWFG